MQRTQHPSPHPHFDNRQRPTEEVYSPNIDTSEFEEDEEDEYVRYPLLDKRGKKKKKKTQRKRPAPEPEPEPPTPPAKKRCLRPARERRAERRAAEERAAANIPDEVDDKKKKKKKANIRLGPLPGSEPGNIRCGASRRRRKKRADALLRGMRLAAEDDLCWDFRQVRVVRGLPLPL